MIDFFSLFASVKRGFPYKVEFQQAVDYLTCVFRAYPEFLFDGLRAEEHHRAPACKVIHCPQRIRHSEKSEQLHHVFVIAQRTVQTVLRLRHKEKVLQVCIQPHLKHPGLKRYLAVCRAFPLIVKNRFGNRPIIVGAAHSHQHRAAGVISVCHDFLTFDVGVECLHIEMVNDLLVKALFRSGFPAEKFVDGDSKYVRYRGYQLRVGVALPLPFGYRLRGYSHSVRKLFLGEPLFTTDTPERGVKLIFHCRHLLSLHTVYHNLW